MLKTVTKKNYLHKVIMLFGQKKEQTKKNISLKGILRGIEITEQDVHLAKQSLFKA